jgi:hypothetical protein
MIIKSNVKAGGIMNHNEKMANDKKVKNFTVKSSVKAGGIVNHNEKLAKSLTIKTGVKAGGMLNHNEKIATDNKVKNLTVKSGIKAGSLNFPKITYNNHNEKLTDDNSRSIEQKKTIGKKLRLSKETIRELKDGDLKQVTGGATNSLTTVCVSQWNSYCTSC